MSAVSSVLSIYSYSISGEDSVSSADKTSNPRLTQQFSSFGDSACGEPLQAQHIIVDFTPDDTVDNEIVEDKICSFWKFIKDNPHIKKFKVQPEKNSYSRPSATVEAEECPREPKYSDDVVVGMDKGAVSMLEVIEKNGLITSTFAKHSQCTLHSEYKENHPDLQNIGKRRKSRSKDTCIKCVNICKPCRKHPKPMSEASLLCNTLTEWDAKHPTDSKSPISSVGGTSNPKSVENYSVFNEGSCGEPLLAQHIIVDFTPNDETDTDFMQKKVCSFWKFIDNNPDIQNLKVKPDKMVYRDESSTNIMTETPKVEPESSIANSEIYKTAVDMLVYAEDKNYIDRLFDAKMPMSNCTLGSREYKEGQLLTRPKKKDKKKPACTCKIDSSTCRVHSNQNKKNTSESRIRLLSRKMNEWDAKHPNHMFTVSCYSFHPLIQRFVRLWRYVQVVSDILTFLLSMICCQCMDGEPLSTSTSVGSKPSVQIFDAQAIKKRQTKEALDQAKSSGEPMRHLFIDFTPGREDTPEIQARCHQYWESAKNRTDLEGMHSSPKPERHLIDLSRGSAHPDTGTDRNNIPAIHTMKKTKKKGGVKTALESGELNSYFT